MKHKMVIVGAAALAPEACGGGSGRALPLLAAMPVTRGPSPAPTPAPAAPPTLSDAKRWNLPIPIKTIGEVRAAPALDIEAALGFTVFDCVSITTADESVITRGLVLRQGAVSVVVRQLTR